MRRTTFRPSLADWLRRLTLSLPVVLATLLAPPSGAQPSPWPDPGAVQPPPEMAADGARPAEARPGPLAREPGSWNVLTLIYRNMDVTSGTNHWTAAMTNAQVSSLQNAVASYGTIVTQWSANLGRVSNTVRVVTRPLSTLTSVFTSYYWVTPDNVATELVPELNAGAYDSIIVIWEGGPVPTNYWGLAYVGPISWQGHSFTWSTVIRGQDWWWSINDAPGEVILHEWLHGLEGHYRNQTYIVPELHGAEEHGYREDAVGGWRTWLRDYLQGKVPEPGRTTGISPAVWASGAVNNPIRPAPCQLLGPLNATDAAVPPSLKWAGPGSSFRARLTNLADNSPAFETTTSVKSITPAQHVLRTDGQYRWQVVAQSEGRESSALEAMTFHYTGTCIAYNMSQAVQALQITAGIGPASVNAMGRMNLETSGPSAGRLDQSDAVRLIRKVSGLEPNP